MTDTVERVVGKPRDLPDWLLCHAYSPTPGTWIPSQYRSWGTVSASNFVGPLMNHFGYTYYVGYLSAAEVHDASASAAAGIPDRGRRPCHGAHVSDHRPDFAIASPAVLAAIAEATERVRAHQHRFLRRSRRVLDTLGVDP